MEEEEEEKEEEDLQEVVGTLRQASVCTFWHSSFVDSWAAKFTNLLPTCFCVS